MKFQFPYGYGIPFCDMWFINTWPTSFTLNLLPIHLCLLLLWIIVILLDFFISLWCFFSLHVLSEDTLSREVKDGKLHTKRLLTKTNVPPKWAERLISSRIVKIVEESIIDPKEKTITTYTRNVGYVKVMVIILQANILFE